MHTITFPRITITNRDVFNIQFLYKVMHHWLLENGYMDDRGEETHETMEKLYLENRYAGEKEFRWWWRTEKKLNSYIRWRLDVDTRIIKAKDVELVQEGRKMNYQHSETFVYLSGFVDFDYHSQWERHPVLKFFEKYFRTRILKQETEQQRAEFEKELYRFEGMIKAYFQQRTFLPEEEELFHEKFESLNPY